MSTAKKMGIIVGSVTTAALMLIVLWQVTSAQHVPVRVPAMPDVEQEGTVPMSKDIVAELDKLVPQDAVDEQTDD